MIKKKGVPISGGAGQWPFTPNVPTNAADTSRDAMKKIRGSATPFQNREGILGVPAPTEKTNRANANFAQDGMRWAGRAKPSIDFAAIGYPKGPYASKKGLNSVNSGSPLSAQRTVGGGNQPKATSGPKFRPGQAKNYPSLRGGYKP